MHEENDEPVYRQYRCWVQSAPGMWASYDGYVDVWSPTEDDVFRRAVSQLARTSFADRPRMGDWRFVRIERL